MQQSGCRTEVGQPVGNSAMNTATVLISEVGPRDGLQSVNACMPTADKLRWISALHAAGLREIEVGSFVPARLLPQLADTAEVVAHALTLPGLTVLALVPNLRGAEAALLRHGVHKWRQRAADPTPLSVRLRKRARGGGALSRRPHAARGLPPRRRARRARLLL